MCVETAITLTKKQTQTHKKHTNIKTETQRHKCKDTNIYIQHIETNKKFFKANCIEETNRNTQTQRLKHKYTSTKTQTGSSSKQNALRRQMCGQCHCICEVNKEKEQKTLHCTTVRYPKPTAHCKISF